MIYVLGDIHGHRPRFESVMKQIDLQPEDTLYVLGDVIDRNPEGIRILRQLRAMPNVVLLLGNHEHMMLQTLYWPIVGTESQVCALREQYRARWYRNGGEVTHHFLKRLRKTTRQELFRYLDSLPVNVEVEVNGKRFLLTHAAPAEDFWKLPSKYTDEKTYAVWLRYTGEEPAPQGRTVIFGHTGTWHYQQGSPARIWHGNGRIGLDCGCAYTREPEDDRPRTRLACLRLDDMREFYSEE